MMDMSVNNFFRLSPLWRENMNVAVGSIKSNRLRSFLTILIIATGITSLVGVLTATEALKEEVFSNFGKIGTNSFTITARRLTSGSAVKGVRVKNSNIITYSQALLFKKRFDFGVCVSLFATLGNMPVKYGSTNMTNPMTNVVAADQHYLQYKNASISLGRQLVENDINAASFICLAGDGIVKALFKNEDPIGKYISVAGIRYEIVGTLAKVGASFGGSIDNEIIIPVSNARSYFISDRISFNIGVVPDIASSVSSDTSVYDKAEALFRALRRLTPSDETDFSINRSDAVLGELIQITGIITLSASIIGLVTLLGAAIGLMNIMLVSVKERTREIGIRKAIGASSERIRQQFLMESVVISQVGCAIGTIAGFFIGNATAMLLGASFIIPWLWMLFAVMICFVVGIASGYIPAKRAADLDPIEALRCE